MENRLLTRRSALQFAVGLAALPAFGQTGRRFEEVRRIPAAEANQGVAVDEQHLYAIDNHAIGKYDKKTGKRVAHWQCERGKPLLHLDSGVVYDGVLWCAHSNYPGVPMTSSIETWDTKTLEHSSSYSFGIANGAANWFDFYKGSRYVTFAHFRGRADEADRDPSWTTLVQYDNEWRQRQSWIYPAEVVAKLGDFSISGGVFTPDGRLYTTGHDNAEVYVFSFPKGGSTLVLEETIPMPMHGQGIALDPADPTLLYGIDRPKKEIIVAAIRS